MKQSFELFDHTADIGMCVRAGSLGGLLEPAGEALYAVIGELVPGGEPVVVNVELTAGDSALLLRDYLGELLTLFELDHSRATSVDVSEFGDTRLKAAVWTSPVDLQRSTIHHEVKAVTYHELGIREIPGGYEATVILDI